MGEERTKGSARRKGGGGEKVTQQGDKRRLGETQRESGAFGAQDSGDLMVERQ